MKRNTAGESIHLVWAARWEHDKNPDDLLSTLVELKRREVSFRISVIGETYRQIPEAFSKIKTLFCDSIESWGFQESRDAYWSVLAGGDIFISTANHEFFGIAAAEAICTGLFPLLPNRLAYPELIRTVASEQVAQDFLYDGSAHGLATRIDQINSRRNEGDWNGTTCLAQPLLARLNWATRARELDDELARICLAKSI